MATHDPNRVWETCLQKAFSGKTRNKLRTKIKEIQKNKQGLTSKFLIEILLNLPNFIGVFPQDYLLSINIVKFPVCFIVNLDLSSQPGSHWIAVNITEKTIEVFDSFGFDKSTWIHEPLILSYFLNCYSKTHRLKISPRLQSNLSNLCGVYSIFFLIFRLSYSFSEILHLFSTDFNLNSTIMLSFFK